MGSTNKGNNLFDDGLFNAINERVIRVLSLAYMGADENQI